MACHAPPNGHSLRINMNAEFSEVPRKMKDLFAKVLRIPPEEINLDSSTKTTKNWDSLRHVELVVEMEEAYGVSFSAVEVFALTSVRGFCETLSKKNANLFD
jgi:acyl carrier protein